MSADRRSVPGNPKDTRAGGRARTDGAMVLMPVAIVTFGATDGPGECLMDLQSATSRAVRVAAEIGRVPGLLISHGLDRIRHVLEVKRAGAWVLTQR